MPLSMAVKKNYQKVKKNNQQKQKNSKRGRPQLAFYIKWYRSLLVKIKKSRKKIKKNQKIKKQNRLCYLCRSRNKRR